MTLRRRLWSALPLLLIALSSNCGVEVGNPHGSSKKGGGGTLTLALADAPVDDAQHVYFNLRALSVVPSTTSGETLPVTLAASGKIDALALQGGKSLDIATEQTLPAGTYRAVVLELDEENPATIVAADGSELPLTFPDASHGIVVEQEFSVVEGEALALTLHLDLRRSISHVDDGGGAPHGRFDFGPVASLARRGDEASLSGTVTDPDLTEVCAYLQRPERPDDDVHGGVFGPGSEHAPPPPADGGAFGPPPQHIVATPPKRLDPGTTTAPDADSSCANAFATAVIVNGAYSLGHLWPGDYFLTFFKKDGTRVDGLVPPVHVDPGQVQAFATGGGIGGGQPPPDMRTEHQTH